MAKVATNRKVPIIAPKHYEETSEKQIGNEEARTLKSTGPVDEALTPPIIEPVNRVVSKQKLENLKFNEDIVTIRILGSDSPTDDPFPTVWNDGRKWVFERDVDTPVARKFVEVLARAKKSAFGLRKVTDNEGVDHYEYPRKNSLRYPFAVIHDPSPKGKQWLDSILREG